MKQLTCEMCGGTELIKQDGFFVCQTCGAKYSVEEAKKIMVEIDTTEKVQGLYQIARRFKQDGLFSDAQKYYGQIITECPSDWEANFYSRYCQWINCKNGEISIVVNQIQKTVPTILALVEENVAEESEKIEAINSISADTVTLMTALNTTATNNKNLLTFNCFDVGVCCFKTLYDLGDYIEDKYGSKGQNAAVLSWCGGIKNEHIVIYGYIIDTNERKRHRDHLESYAEKVRKYDSSYKAPEVFIRGESSGCYVATCVYGSYDCPQVWTLRRYRDDILGSTWYGRLFIRTYYAISPTLVKWFGNTSWFKKMWKGKLDRMVTKLQNNGVEDTPYEDKNW